MTYLSRVSARAVAFVSALALSAVFLSTAILPAMPSVWATGMLS